MELQEATKLINWPGLQEASPTIWADFGSGSGLFTTALAKLLAPGSKVYAIDKKPNVLKTPRMNEVSIESIVADFTSPLQIADVDGILMANSFHFVSDKIKFCTDCRRYFKGDEVFLIVEYNTDIANTWVPYPVSYASLTQLFVSLGFTTIEKIADVPSKYHGEIYSVLVKR